MDRIQLLAERDEELEQGLTLLRGPRFHGVSQVEFKRDPRDGAYKLMEVNPRLWHPPYVDPLLAWDDPSLAVAHLTRLVHLRLGRRRSG